MTTLIVSDSSRGDLVTLDLNGPVRIGNCKFSEARVRPHKLSYLTVRGRTS